MIKLIIVDDERATREGLIKHIPWKAIGIDNVECAKNGFEALEKAELLQPDIILTDVLMPRMNGIQLATLIRERYPECKIIFLSGYSDKEFLKSAIKLSALNYIEKPIDENEVISTISNAVMQYKSEHNKKVRVEMLDTRIKRNTYLIRQKLAVDLIKSGISFADLKGMFEDAGRAYQDNSFYTTVVVRFNWNRKLSHNDKENFRSNISTYLCNIMQDISDWFLSGYLDSELYIIHFKEKIQAIQNWERKLKSLLDKIMTEACGNYTISIGVGLPVYGLESLKNSFNTAVQALEMQFYSGVDSIIYYSSLNPGDSGNQVMDERFFSVYSESLAKDKRNEVIMLLNNYYSDIVSVKSPDSAFIRDIYLKLLFDLHIIAKKRGVILVDKDDAYAYLRETISNMNTLEKIHNYLISQVKAFFGQMDEKEACGRNVYNILKFIQNNYYNRKLSVKFIAEQMSFSESYLCTFFKKSTGKTVNNYITEIRIDKAKELLRDKNIKLYEVAKKVGYENENYFSKIFRKCERSSPSEFRERFFL